MTQTLIEQASQFLKDNETICFTKLTSDPNEMSSFDTSESYLEALTLKQNLLSDAFTLLRSLLCEAQIADHNNKKDLQDIQQENRKIISLNNSEISELKNLLAEHYEKELNYERQIDEFNEHLEKLMGSNNQKEEECKALYAQLTQLNESFQRRVQFCNQVTLQLQELHRDYLKLSEFNQSKLLELTTTTQKNQALSDQLRQFQQEIILIQIENRELDDEVRQARSELQKSKTKNQLLEVMLGKVHDNQNRNIEDKENKCTLNIPSLLSCGLFGEFQSPRDRVISAQFGKVEPPNTSYQKQKLNELSILRSGNHQTIQKGVFNIEDKLQQYLSPMRQANITDFEQCRILVNSVPEEPSPICDPYHCFFVLLVQCAKINCHNCELAALVNLNDLESKFIQNRVTMNLWGKMIEEELRARISIQFQSNGKKQVNIC